MALNFVAPERKELTPRITVFGVGGAGGNAVNNMIDKNLEGVEFVVANTDAQALQQSQARSRIQLGVKATEGLGAGARPAVGASAAEETLEEIIDHLSGAHMCFITAGMGGGTGTGAAPIIAQAAREMGVLTVGVVTKPFSFEGAKRMRQAEDGVEALQKVVDTLIIIPNQNLFRLANEKTTFTEAFALADDVLYQGVKGVTDLMVRPGMINLDFADVRAVMDEMGKAMMGTGEASGEDRARVAAEKAIANPLLDEISLNGARGVLINITGGHDLTLFELDEAANLIREKVDPEANIIVGSTLDPAMEGMLRVSVVATGIESQADASTLDVQRRRLAEPLNAPAPEPVEEPAPVAARDDVWTDQRADHQRGDYRRSSEVEPQGHERRQDRADDGWQGGQTAPQQNEFDLDEILDDRQYDTRRRVAPVQRHAETRPMAPEPAPRRFEAPPAREMQQRRYMPLSQEEPAWQPEDQNWREQTGHAQSPATQDPMSQDRNMARRNAGVPSPETLQRLRAAVEKQPEAGERETDGYRHAGHQNAGHQHGGQAHRAPNFVASRHGEAAGSAEGRSRFGGLGSLIGRMTGQGHEGPGPSRGPAPAVRHDMDPHDDARRHDPEDRVEMPAFLRRQAN